MTIRRYGTEDQISERIVADRWVLAEARTIADHMEWTITSVFRDVCPWCGGSDINGCDLANLLGVLLLDGDIERKEPPS